MADLDWLSDSWLWRSPVLNINKENKNKLSWVRLTKRLTETILNKKSKFFHQCSCYSIPHMKLHWIFPTIIFYCEFFKKSLFTYVPRKGMRLALKRWLIFISWAFNLHNSVEIHIEMFKIFRNLSSQNTLPFMMYFKTTRVHLQYLSSMYTKP